ncbi:MAG: hypothetical protein AB1716_02805 [Planctomycetota bacterium]
MVKMDGRTSHPNDVVGAARLDKRVFGIGTLDDRDEIAYWRSRTPAERLEAVELLRQINYGEAAVTGRLQRVFEVAELGWG